MKKISFKISCLSPILIPGAKTDPNSVTSLDYIPGRLLLGYYAGKFIKANELGDDAHLNSDFYSLFLSDSAIFSNSYITDEDNRIYIPTPISIEKEKYEKEIYDLLILADEDSPENPTKKIGGYIHISGDDVYKKEVEKIYNFHHERNRETGSTKKGVIFNYEAIAKDQAFLGEIVYDEKFEPTIKSFLKDEIIYLGKSKNSQYGKVKIEFLENIDELNKDEDDKTLTLLSDTIILDDNGITSLNIDNFAKKLGVKITNSFVKPTVIETYNSKLRFKTPSKDAFLAGSCFMLEKLPDNYKELEIRGFGENRNEGFGKVIFGLQKNDNELSLKERDNEPKDKPKYELPKIAKEIMRELIQNKMVERVKISAMEEANEFQNKLISSSLAGKLQLFVKNSKNFTDFEKKMKTLRDTAKNSLQKCNNKSKYLNEYLENERLLSEEQENHFTKAKLNEFDFIIDKNLLFKEFYKEFFITLRKMNKNKGGEE